MTKIFITDCSFFKNEQMLAQTLPRLESRRRKKVRSLMSPIKKAQSAAAGLLLNMIFGETATYRYTDSGKPYLTDKRAYFSISHTDKWVALAVSDREIGFDLQILSPIRPAVLHRCFSSDEQRWIGESDERFTQLWTRKEAYAKYTGQGIMNHPFDIAENLPYYEGSWNDAYFTVCGDTTIATCYIDEKDLL